MARRGRADGGGPLLARAASCPWSCHHPDRRRSAVEQRGLPVRRCVCLGPARPAPRDLRAGPRRLLRGARVRHRGPGGPAVRARVRGRDHRGGRGGVGLRADALRLGPRQSAGSSTGSGSGGRCWSGSPSSRCRRLLAGPGGDLPAAAGAARRRRGRLGASSRSPPPACCCGWPAPPSAAGRRASTAAGFLLGGIVGPAFGGAVVGVALRAPFFLYAGTLALAAVAAPLLPRGEPAGPSREVAAGRRGGRRPSPTGAVPEPPRAPTLRDGPAQPGLPGGAGRELRRRLQRARGPQHRRAAAGGAGAAALGRLDRRGLRLVAALVAGRAAAARRSRRRRGRPPAHPGRRRAAHRRLASPGWRWPPDRSACCSAWGCSPQERPCSASPRRRSSATSSRARGAARWRSGRWPATWARSSVRSPPECSSTRGVVRGGAGRSAPPSSGCARCWG